MRASVVDSCLTLFFAGVEVLDVDEDLMVSTLRQPDPPVSLLLLHPLLSVLRAFRCFHLLSKCIEMCNCVFFEHLRETLEDEMLCRIL